MTEPRIPAEVLEELLATDAYWGAIGRALLDEFARDARVWRHVDVEDRVIDFPAMLAEPWSGGERRFLAGLAGLWDTGNDDMIGLGELATLGDGRWRRLLQAADELREGLR
jgi:hypothetical protein